MIKKLKTLTLMFVLAISTAFTASSAMAYDSGPETSCDIERQSSTFFINDYIRGYTTQIAVLPGRDKMIVTFYDEIGREIKLDGVRSISGQAILVDGSRQDVIFFPERSLHNKKRSRRGTSTFIARGEWIGSAEGFYIAMDVPIEGDIFEVAYSHGCDPSGSRQLAMIIAR